LEPSNVKRIVEEADGYQPHLIAPEMGYRRLLQECLVLFKGPADTAVGEVHHVLRSIVASTINSEDCKNLQQYTSLKREIVTTASASLGKLTAIQDLQFWHECGVCSESFVHHTLRQASAECSQPCSQMYIISTLCTVVCAAAEQIRLPCLCVMTTF